ncbi:MAG TPA: hypothetical protein ENJ84_10775 [Gammaproteobacteria bacterium]|nr:hypothetical protein [Gammaproteobacteria bacterium]
MMASHSEKFMDCQIEISANDNLTIDGKPIVTATDGAHQQWSSTYLPYTQYPTLRELARAIIRDTGEFRTQKISAGNNS